MQKSYFSYPKINVFFKIVGFEKSGYCEVFSRYVRVKDSVCDEISITQAERFSLRGDCACKVESNTIFRAKNTLARFLESSTNPAQRHKARFLEGFRIEIDKKIPICAGLGGGSSNAAVYLLAINEALELGLDGAEMRAIATKVGSDVAFFASDCDSANVRGVGEKIEIFSEIVPQMEIFTPKIACATKAVFDEFRAHCAPSVPKGAWLRQDSVEILGRGEIGELNDLYAPALRVYGELRAIAGDLAKDGYFFSGSGSSFFRIQQNAESRGKNVESSAESCVKNSVEFRAGFKESK